MKHSRCYVQIFNALYIGSVKLSIPSEITKIMEVRLIFELLCLDIGLPCYSFPAIAFALTMSGHLLQNRLWSRFSRQSLGKLEEEL